jgi:hypothetical protein
VLRFRRLRAQRANDDARRHIKAAGIAAQCSGRRDYSRFVNFGLLFFFVIVVLIVRALLKSINTVNSSKSTARRQQLQDLARRMRATAQQTRPGFPQPPGATYGQEVGGPGYQAPPSARPGSTAPFQPPPTARPGSTAPFQPPPTAQRPPTAPIAPPTPAFTAQWPSGAPMDPTPRSPLWDPVVVEVAEDQAPGSAYPTGEPTAADSSTDTTADVIENATTPRRQRYELSSSLDTTLSTSLTSSVIGEPGSIAAGPQTVALTPDLQQRVLDLMNQGYEVMAVRLVCDEMDVGILEAHKTVRSLAGLPTLL